MSRFFKIIAGLLVLLVIFCAGIYLLARHYLTQERIKALLEPPLERATGLQVDLGEIKQQGFSRVSIQQVIFQDPSTHQKVFTVDKINLSLRLFPLLKGKLVVANLEFLHPSILVIRGKDGRINLEHYLLRTEKQTSKSSEAPAVKAKASSQARWALIFQRLTVKGATVTFRDKLGELPPVETQFSLDVALRLQGTQLSFSGAGLVSHISLADYPLLKQLRFDASLGPKSISLNLRQGEFLKGSISGLVESDFRNLSGTVTLKSASMEAVHKLVFLLRPYLFPQAQLPKMAGVFDASAKIKGPLREPYYLLTLDLNHFSVSLPPYEAVLEGQIVLDPRQIKPELSVTLNQQRIHLAGQVEAWQEKVPRINLVLKGQKIDAKALFPPSERARAQKDSPHASKPQGSVPLVLPVQGQLLLEVKSLCYDLCAEDLQAKTHFSPQQLDLWARCKLAKGPTELSLRIEDLASPLPRSYLAYKAEKLDLPTLLMPFASKAVYVTRGTLSTKGKLQSRGLSVAQIKQNLVGKGEAYFLSLGLKEIPAAVMVADLLGLPDLARLSFDKGKLLFRIKRQQVYLDGAFTRPDLAFLLQGKVSLKGYLDLQPRFLLGKPYASRLEEHIPGVNFLVNQGRLEVPLQVKGPFDKPKVRLLLTNKVKEKIEKKIEQKLFEFLGR